MKKVRFYGLKQTNKVIRKFSPVGGMSVTANTVYGSSEDKSANCLK